MLNTIALGIILIVIVLACTDLLRPGRNISLAVTSITGANGKAGARTTPGVPVYPSRDGPIILHGFDPRLEALVVQVPRIARESGEDAGFAIRPAADGPGLDILFLGRLLVRLPEVPSDSDVDLYLETMPA